MFIPKLHSIAAIVKFRLCADPIARDNSWAMVELILCWSANGFGIFAPNPDTSDVFPALTYPIVGELLKSSSIVEIIRSFDFLSELLLPVTAYVVSKVPVKTVCPSIIL